MRVKVAAAQMCSGVDLAANQATIARLTAQAAEEGCAVVSFPECAFLLAPGRAKHAIAEPITATPFRPDATTPLLQWTAELASRHHIDVLIGGFWETSPNPSKVRNSAIYVRADGSVESCYRKIHLYDVALADGTRLMESDTVEPGHDICTTQAPFGVLGHSVCYDLRFPELYRKLVDLGAIALSIPAAFTLTTGKDHWHVLLRARAIESQAYVIASAQIGLHFGDRRSYGHALICDPWGTVIAECGDNDELALAYVDTDNVDRIRRQLPSLKHRVLR